MPPKAKKAKKPSPEKEDKPEVDPIRKTRSRSAMADSQEDKKDAPKKKVKDDPPAKSPKKKEEQKPKGGKKAKSEPKEQPKEKSKPKDDKKDKPVEEKKLKAKAQEQPQITKVVMKGLAPVDEHFQDKNSTQVFSSGGITYSTTLNQSNISANNNKFYILQILQSSSGVKKYYFFTRWGRVGVPGQQATIPCFDSQSAIRAYNSKLNDKLKGGYREVQMNYEADEVKDQKPKKQKAKKTDEPQVQSNLRPAVQDLVRLIFDMKMMNSQMKEIGYDSAKMPLGKLAKSSILKGYQALKGLMDQIKNKKRRDMIERLSSDFYSEIPHDFGFQKMQNFILDSESKIKQKLQMLQSLEDIQVFTKLLDQGDLAKDINELDNNYLKLKTNLTPLDPNSSTYKLLVEYVHNTHASTHTAYRLQVQQIFQVQKEQQGIRFRKDISNKQLLWHGSRLTNFVGILSQGLRIAPPEAPVTGYMFGKGVYFADMVTKSANYCFTSRQNNTGLMLLCEVALGDCNQKFYADYYANLLPDGKHSTKGCGKTAPSGGKMLGDVYVPCMPGVNTGIANASLLYNQFIVYDVAQIKCRYLFKMKFNYSGRGW